MARMQRAKGQRGERELLALITKLLADRGHELTLHRNHAQTECGGADCLDIPGVALEVKRQENIQIASWWRQAISQAKATSRLPVLGYRRNRADWAILVPTYAATGLDYPIQRFQKRTQLPAAYRMTLAEFTNFYLDWRIRTAPIAPRPQPVTIGGLSLE